MMETGEVSLHRLKVYRFLRDAKGWKSNHEIAAGCDGVSHRTVRLHTKALVDLGILDQAEVFPGHRFRVSEQAEKRNKAYVMRLNAAAEVFGLG